MSLRPDRSLLEVLRGALRKAEVDHGPETPTVAELKRLPRECIAVLESIPHLVDSR